jgi:hypothetical protein
METMHGRRFLSNRISPGDRQSDEAGAHTIGWQRSIDP